MTEIRPDAAEAARQRERMAEQLRGIERVEGTYPFTLEVSHRAYRLNDFLRRLTAPEHRRRFLEDTQALYDEFGLSE